jgi:hypothetical protein
MSAASILSSLSVGSRREGQLSNIWIGLDARFMLRSSTPGEQRCKPSRSPFTRAIFGSVHVEEEEEEKISRLSGQQLAFYNVQS